MKKGFTLVEMLVALGLISVVLIIVGEFSHNMVRVLSKVETSKTMADTMEQLRSTLAVSEQCTLNLTNIPITLPQAELSPVLGISTFDLGTGTAASLIANNGQNMSGVIVENMGLRPLYRIETGLIMGELEIVFRPAGLSQEELDNAGAGGRLIRTLPMLIRVQNNRVSSCWVKSEKNIESSANICQMLSNGLYNYYDKEKGVCVTANGRWIDGTLNSASCPPGAFLPDGAHHSSNCSGELGGNDENAKISITMADGSTARISREPVLVRFSGVNTCACDWAADLTSAQLVNARCQILCIVP